ncbi:hypothetical protein [Ensifer sp. 4252]|uniref:hypothetical protein n=1 Tax=Ensifer sp. 4252 TaxID=3373915 RepID=UPI003D21A0F1
MTTAAAGAATTIATIGMTMTIAAVTAAPGSDHDDDNDDEDDHRGRHSDDDDGDRGDRDEVTHNVSEASLRGLCDGSLIAVDNLGGVLEVEVEFEHGPRVVTVEPHGGDARRNPGPSVLAFEATGGRKRPRDPV